MSNNTTPKVIKKLKIYTTLFSIAFVWVVLSSVFFYNVTYEKVDPEEKLEMVPYSEDYMIVDSVCGGVRKTTPSMFSLEVNVRPKHNQFNDSLMLMSSSLGQTYKVEMQKVKLYAPTSKFKNAVFITVVISVSALVMLVMGVWTFVLVIKLIKCIRRLEFFADNFSKILERTGILLAVVYFVQLFGGLLVVDYLNDQVAMAGYEIVNNLKECNAMFLLTGLGLMIISQIMLIASKIKEEQDLTI